MNMIDPEQLNAAMRRSVRAHNMKSLHSEEHALGRALALTINARRYAIGGRNRVSVCRDSGVVAVTKNRVCAGGRGSSDAKRGSHAKFMQPARSQPWDAQSPPSQQRPWSSVVAVMGADSGGTDSMGADSVRADSVDPRIAA
jgi:hypothetical protein